MSEVGPDEPTVEPTDERLVERAVGGDIEALEALVSRHRPWVYNVAVRMVYGPDDADDVTQEVLLKAVTGLAGFRGKSSFRTWLYRIACNHVLNMRRRPAEEQMVSFSRFASDLESSPDLDLPDPDTIPVDRGLLVEEAKLGCLTAMLLGLDRRQRLAYVLSELLGTPSAQAAELMELSAANHRQVLSRARRALHGFMDGTCGIVRTENRCRCAKKAAGFVAAGHIDPSDVRFARPGTETLESAAPADLEALESRIDHLHREQHRRTRLDRKSVV